MPVIRNDILNRLEEPCESYGFLVVKNDRIIECNARIQELLERPEEKDIIGHKFFDLAPDYQQNGKKSFDFYKEMADEAKQGGRSSFSFMFNLPDGAGISMNVVFLARSIEEDLIHAVLLDASEPIRQQHELEKTSQLYNSIFNNNHTPMLIIDSTSGSIKDGNVAACRYYGYSKDQLLQLNIRDINTMSDAEIFERIEIAKSEDRKYFEFRHRLANGEIRAVEVYSGPIKVEDENYLLSIIHDVQYKKEMEQRIRIQESYFKGLFENSPEAIAILDNEFRILKINNSFERIFQYSLKEIKLQNITRILCEEQFYDESTYIKDGIKRGEFVRKETKRKRKDGALVDVSFLGFPIISNGEQIGVYTIYSDISTIKEIESKKRLFAEIFKNNTVGVVVTDVEGNIQWVNDAFSDITGYQSDEVIGKNPRILKSGRHETEYYCNMWHSILNSGKWQGEIFNKRKNGEIYQEWLSIMAVKDDLGRVEYFVAMLSDITDAKRKENRIEILTNRDSLTDLYNRDYFANRLNYEVSKRNKEGAYKELAIIFIDIDDFKDINDSLGHLVGDLVLQEFAFRLRSSIRDCDIAARFGGDEFIIMISSYGEESELLNISNRIIEATGSCYLVENTELVITASLGIARYPADGIDSTILIRNADIAMYRSKELKEKKITLFEASLDEKVKEYFVIKNGLRNAIENEELFVEYQPIFHLGQDRIVGVEALLRWKLNKRELVSPLKFIPIAEKTGMMPMIGAWVLREACRQNKAWQDRGYAQIFVSVNVSIVQIEQSSFYGLVQEVLKETGLEPRYLQLEITETIFTKNYEAIAGMINKIKSLGVNIAIDDFGTGYSSLGQLSRLEISKLKIDKAFISEINQSENKNQIVKAIISLAGSLKLDLVAEGVETKQQMAFLQQNECSMMQGYLFSKPLAAEALEVLFLDGHDHS